MNFPFKITSEPNRSDRLESYLSETEDMYYYIEENEKPSLKKVERFFLRWKRYPEVWNYYYMALLKNHRYAEARKLLYATIKEFPNYLFARCNEAVEEIRRGNLDGAMQWFGETPDLQCLYPERDTFFEIEVVNYYKTFIYWEIEKGNLEQAEKYIEMIRDFESADNELSTLKYQIMVQRLKEAANRYKKQNAVTPEYIKPDPPTGFSHKPFTHKEIESMLEEVQLTGKEQIDTILALPRETAIADLEQLVYRALYEYTDEDYDRNNYQLLSHAVWLLYEFRAFESIPIINSLLEMDNDTNDYWYGDYYVDYTWFVFFILLEKTPQPVLEILRKPNLGNSSKHTVLEAIVQLALHHPRNRDIYIGWLDDILQFHIDNLDDKNIYDTVFVGLIEYAVLDMKAESLLPKLKILHKCNAIDENICGSFNDVEENIKLKTHLDKKKELPTIYELVDEENNLLEKYEKMKKEEIEKRKYTLSKELDEKFYAKTGRNDPCPCGSGKKYKKCCGK